MTSRRARLCALGVAFCLVTWACGEDPPSTFEDSFGNEGDVARPSPSDTETAEGEAPAEDQPPASQPLPDDASDAEGPDSGEVEESADGDAIADEPPPPAVLPESLSLSLTNIVELDRPIDMATRAGSDNIFVGTKGGRVVEVDPQSQQIVQELIDIGDLVDDAFESGLLGIAFSPDGQTFYLHYSDADHNNNVVALGMDGDVIASGSGRTLLVVEQPADNHNGGDLAFGPDGYLYIALGDGGGSGDPFDNGQDPTTLLGAILRVDPTDTPYAIPSDNPFAGGVGADEVYLYGVRNPWRISFDRATGDLWIADVGQDAVEEVNVAYASDGRGLGANLGWNDVEGNNPFAAAGPPAGDEYLAPIFQYPRAEGCSVTGGYVYRGTAIPQLQGNYIFGDYCTGELWGLTTSQTAGFIGRFDLGLRPPGDGLVSFGEGPNGELYVLTFPTNVYRIDPS